MFHLPVIQADYNFNFTTHIISIYSIENLKPFCFLTPDALEVLHQIIEKNQVYIQSNERIPNFLRGLVYHSTFIRELCYHPLVLEYLSKLTGIQLIPHYLASNVGHVNIGLVNQKDVDQWHYDSVPYVLIILLTDPGTFHGGNLDYELNDEIHKVEFLNAGQAIFLKGSKIKHHVTKVLSGKRITLINSYMDANDLVDNTKLSTFSKEQRFNQELYSGKLEWMSKKLLTLSKTDYDKTNSIISINQCIDDLLDLKNHLQ